MSKKQVFLTCEERERIKQIKEEYVVGLHTAKKIFEKEKLIERIESVNLNNIEEIKQLLIDIVIILKGKDK